MKRTRTRRNRLKFAGLLAYCFFGILRYFTGSLADTTGSSAYSSISLVRWHLARFAERIERCVHVVLVSL